SGAAGTLNGTTAADKFVVAGTQSVAVNGTTFNQVTSVTANDGDDDVQSDVVNWTIEGEKSTTVNGIAFSGVESINKFNSTGITNRNLNGTSGQDLLTIESANNISAKGITYYGIGSVDALGNSEADLDTVSGSTAWDLLVEGFEAFGINFTGVEIANSGAAGALNGTTAADNFVVAGTQSVAVNGTIFNQVISVTASDGDDDVQYDSLDWTIQGTNATSIEGIAFTDVESINQFNSTDITNRNLNGTAGQDLLTIHSANAISAKGITYYGIGSVDALGNSEVDLDTVSGSSTWDLLASGFEAFDISFTGVEIVNSGATGALNGTTAADQFAITGNQSVLVNGITFNNITKVDAQSNTNTAHLDSVSGSATWGLSENGFTANQINFVDVEIADSGTAGTVNGSLIADSFEITGDQSVLVNGTTFNNITTVNAQANTNAEHLDSVSGSATWGLSENGFTANQINFIDVETADSGSEGTVNGSLIADSFAITGDQSVLVNGTTFNNITTVNAQANTNTEHLDSVSGSTIWGLSENGFTANQINFIDVETADSGSEGTVNGSLIADSFAITGDQSVLVNGTTFNNITTVNAQANTNAEHLDSVSGSATWGLSGNGFTANQINFIDVETADSGSEGTVNGSLIADSFEITGDQSVLVNGTTFNNITTVDAQANTNAEHLDSVSGSTTWDLLSTGFKANEISFIDVETADSGSAGTVNGSLIAESFAITDSESVLVNGTTFTNVTVVNGGDGDGDDVQRELANWDIQAANTTTLDGIDFSGIESVNKYISAGVTGRSIAGTDLQDAFSIIGENTIKVNGITYYGIGIVNAGNNTDTVTGLTGQAWTIYRDGNTFDGFSGSGVIFRDIEIADSLSSGSLTGTDLSEIFKTTGSLNQVIFGFDAITFNGISRVDAKQQSTWGYRTGDRLYTNNNATESFVMVGDDVVGNGITFVDFERMDGEIGDTFSAPGSQLTYVLKFDENLDTYDFISDNRTGTSSIETNNYTQVSDTSVVSFQGLSNASTEIFTLKKNDTGNYQIVVSIGGVEVESAEFLTLLSVDGLNNNDTFIFDSTATLESVISFDASSNSFNASLTGAESTLFSNFKIYNLSALVNELSIDVKDTVAASTFTLVNGENYKFSFGGTEFHGFNNVTSSYTPIEGDLLNTLAGSDQADSFATISGNQLTANGIVFSDIGTVNAGLGDDDIEHTQTAWVIQAGNNTTTVESIDFTGIDSINKDNGTAITDRSLTGTAGDDAFAYEGRNAVSANGITYYGIGSVNGAGEGVSGDDVQHNFASWTIQGSEATSIEGIAFTDIESINQFNSTNITNRNLNGTAGQDLLTIHSANVISANGITYYGIGSVDALGNTEADLDTVSGSTTWDLLASGFEAFDISFAGVEIANSAAGGTLSGTAAADKFVVAGTQSVAANGTTFNQVTSVTASDGDDDVQYDSLDWTIQGTNATSIEGIAFTDVESINKFNSTDITNRNLNGTTGQDLLNIEGTNAISANGITYYGIGSVDALGNSETDFDTVSGSTSWNLLVEGFGAFGINFTGVEIANSGAAGTLNGTTAADKFVVAGTQSVAVNGTTFNQVTSVTANDGDDDVQSDVVNWTIEGEKSTTVNGIAFSGIESINKFNSTGITNRNLNGTSGQDLLTIESANNISAKGITYYGIGSVDALGNSEVDLDTVSGSTAWNLLVEGFEAFGINFTGVEIANSGAAGTLNGTTAADNFVVAGTQSVAANGTTFNQVTSVTASDGDDDVQYDSADWTIQGTEATSIEGIAFTDVESINQFNSAGITSRNLNGTIGQDQLNIEGTNRISANGITYYGIGTVDALENSTVDLDTVSGSTTWDLLAGGFAAFDISFTGVEIANSGSAGILNGTTAADNFVVAGTQSVAANGTTFNQVTSVIASDGDDDVQYDSADWSIQGTEATSIEGIAFTDVESINQFNSTGITTRNLNGTTGQDLLNIEGTNAISANGITYYGIGTVDALGNSTADLDTVTGSTTWDLLAAGFEAFNISFTDVEIANSGAAGILSGTTAADKFVVAGTQSVAANGTTFNQVTSVTASDGDDDVQSDLINWTIEGVNATTVDGVAFTDVESINQFNSTNITNRNLNGTTGQDLLNIEGTNTISANGITYYGIGSVDTLGETDTVTGSTTWSLLAAGFEAFGIGFTSVETANSGAAGVLNGTENTDKFVVAGSESVAANGTTFNQVISVTAGDGDDDVQYDSVDWTIQGAEATSIEGIAFTNVESINQFNSTDITTRNLNGTTGQDLLTIEGTNAISAMGITYYGIGSVDALGETDRVSGSTTWDLLASGFEAFDMSFVGVEIANSSVAGILNGTTAADKFVVAGSQSVAANGTTFNQVTSVTGSDGDDDVQYDSVDWTIQGKEATSIDDIAFTDVETVNKFNSQGITNRNLSGTNARDILNIKGANTINANGITYYGIGFVDAKGGELDTVVGSNTWDLLSTGFKASGMTFLDTEVANSGNNGRVNGTDGKDEFEILSGQSQSVSANGTRFNQITNVDGKGHGFDEVSGSKTWNLQSTGFESAGINFTSIEVANSGNNGKLNGTSLSDSFVIRGSQSITANGTTFNQVTNVDAKGYSSASELDTVSGSNTWNLLATGFESSGIDFINTEIANSSANGLINGTELKDEFLINGTQSVDVNGTTFNQITRVDAKGNTVADELDTVSGSSTWTLLTAGFESTGISFTNIEVANSGSKGKLSGTNNADHFVIQGSQSVAANGTTFNQIVSVDAIGAFTFGGIDTVSGSSTWDLLSEGFKADGIIFTNAEVANSGADGLVNGTDLKDEFVISGTQSVKANGTTFNQVTKVDAKNNTFGQFDTVSGSNTWDILSEGFKASEINFFNIETANSGAAGSVNGTELEDEFEITGIQSVAINGTTFNQITQVDAKGNTVEGELDTVSGSNTWDLLSEGFKASEISFLNTEIANSGSEGVLNGTSNTDEFYLAGQQSVTVNNTTFNQVTSVNAQGGDNKLVGMAVADEFYLSAINSVAGISALATVAANSNKVTSQGIDFDNITNIDGGAGENRVHGSAGSDSFQLTDTRQQLISHNMTFNNIQAVVAADGEDNLIGQDSQRWQVSNIDNTIVAQDIRFSEIETVSNSGLGILIGSDQADQFVLVSSNGSATDNAVMVNQLVFSNIGSIDAGESELGEDVVTSDIEQTWQLADDNNFIVNGILLSNIERANAAASTVMGSLSEDVFVTTDITNTVIANDVYFENVTLLDGDNPGLTLTYSADLDAQQNNLNNVDQVAAADKFITNSNNSITITQGDGVDSFSQSGSQAGLSFDFKNIEVVDIVTTGDVNSTSGFEYLTIDASNLSINTSEDITFNDFDITNDLTINTKGDLIFLNDVEFTGKDVSVSGDNVSFRGGLKIASNTFAIAANKLNVEGDIDADVNAERSVATDIGQDINASIFNSIDIFLASESSILRKDEIDNADRLKRLLEETELEL
ncbi:MAG: hypothetical protein ACI978_000276, partial [Oleispira sp.]